MNQRVAVLVDEERNWRRRLAVMLAGLRADLSFAVIDVLLIVLAYVAASVFRMLDPNVVNADRYWRSLVVVLPFVVVIHVLSNLVAGVYGHVWEYASVSEARRVLVGSTIASGVIVSTAIGWDLTHVQLNPVPLGTLVMGATFTIAAMGAVRFRSRMFSFQRMRSDADRPRILVVGTDSTAASFAQTVVNSREGELVGFISSGSTSEARHIAGAHVLGGLPDLRDVVSALGINQIVLSRPEPATVRKVVDTCLDNQARLSILPDVSGMINGSAGIRDPRDLEVTDMLPRPTVDIDLADVARLVRGRRVLITGAGGSIGSEILHQVSEFDPESVVALDNDETHLYEARLGLGDVASVRLALCDVRERQSVHDVFERFRPDVVFHAAAHKHVPILEEHPAEAVKTNVLGTLNLLDACVEHEVDRFVLISTDKAVDPANVMGASKRIAEILVQAFAVRTGPTVFTAVRFGNVLGSRGSVVPTFVEQIKRGGPVTITDPEMTRYFMTIGEAVQLVLQASAMARGGEIHVLDMGQPVRIVDLAHRMIRLAGLVPGRDIDIHVVGRRPGEKLTEELSIEPLQSSEHPRIRTVRPAIPGGPVTVLDAIGLLRGAVANGESDQVRSIMFDLIAARADHEVVNLDELEPVRQWS